MVLFPFIAYPFVLDFKRGALNLALNYLSFVVSGLWCSRRLIKNNEYDVVFVFGMSPIIQALPAIYIKWMLKKTHLAVWVQDLWPESLSATEYVRNSFLIKLVGYLVKFIYSKSDTLLVQSKAFIDPVSHYSNIDKVRYYPNSILLKENNAQLPLPESLIKTLKNYFCVVFAGNVGTAQSVETILEAAQLMLDVTEVKFVIVGSGSMLDSLISQKEAMGLSNVVIAGRFSVDVMPTIYQHASALLVILKDNEIFSKTIPSKLQAYLAAGQPIIASINGEAARVVEESGAGVTCQAEDPDALANCVRNLYGLTDEERSRLGEAGYDYFLNHFEMTRQAKYLVELLEQRILEVQRGN